jgi:DUF438 domain-containing protein
MTGRVDLNKSVYELTKEYPKLIDVMAGIGFTEITKKAMLDSVGRRMTIPKGAKMKNIPMTDVVSALTANGFVPEGSMPQFDPGEKSGHDAAARTGADEEQPEDRGAQLKSYLKRLGAGEDLESVRADFVKNFSEVEASEIMKAEQELLKEGTPLTEVQKLCDIHSALFHGATKEEKTANAEKAVQESVRRQKIAEAIAKRDSFPKKDYSDKNERAAALAAVKGHPLYTFTKENEALAGLIDGYRSSKDEGLFDRIREISVHYAKKGDLLYPNLKVRYGISGPADVMWTVDDEIRDELGELAKEERNTEDWNARLDAVLTRAEEMIYKEKNILFPICAVNFTDEEWYGIYRDSKDYAVCFGVKNEDWKEAEGKKRITTVPAGDEVVMPGGHLTVEQLTALLNTIPLEISFVDADNINRFFNEGPKVFKRPGMAIDREVFSCHPPKIEPMVRSIIDDFRSGRQDSVPVWMEKNGRTMLVTYMAVRDKDKKYLGTVELVQDMEFAKEHFSN